MDTHSEANECGQCTACGLVEVGKADPLHFDAEGLAVFRAAAANNATLEDS